MNRKIRGDLAEEIALSFERGRVGKDHLVRFVGNQRKIGFDIQSVDDCEERTPRFIEVKTLASNGAIFVTEYERNYLSILGNRAWLYVVDVDLRQVVHIIQNPIKAFGHDGAPLIYKFKI